MALWDSPVGPLDLTRWPPKQEDTLQAWDGADAYLIEALQERELEGPVLVVGDPFGALGTALAGRCAVWADSELSRLALESNLQRNDRPPVPWTPLTQAAPRASAVLGRLPRSSRRLAWLLARLAEVMEPGTPLILGGRSKLVQKSMVSAVEAAIGPANTTLARHRARLIVAVRDARAAPEPPARPWAVEPGLAVRALPGVFGEERLDHGTHLLLDALPSGVRGTIVDLGCGAGVLGLAAAKRSPKASLLFRDASHLAVESARRSWAASGLRNEARFEAGDVLDGVPSGSAALVLCNPPFHQGEAISRRVAAHMILEARRVLASGGRLLLVGNRHLGYHRAMSGHYDPVESRVNDRRFVVLDGVRR